MSGLFVTGTDTGIGKSLVSVALLHVARQMGLRVIGMKPVAAGAELRDEVWVNEDVLLLTRESDVTAPPEMINPYLFREPIAPHVAADRKGMRIEIPRILEAYEALADKADLVCVEGVGGFLVPLDEQRTTADLAVALGLPVILVVGMRLGCLNHALLSVEAIAARGLHLAGWVANRADPAMLAHDENLASLTRRIPAPLLAEIPHLRSVDAVSAARFVSAKRLADLLRPGH